VCVCVGSLCVYISSSTFSTCFVLSGTCFANGMTTLWSMLLTWATKCCMLKGWKPYKHIHSGSWRENKELQWHFKQMVTFHLRNMFLLSYSLSNKPFNSFTMLPSSSCTCVLLHNLWTLPYVTWRIFYSGTFPQFILSPFFVIWYTTLLSGFAIGHPGQCRVPLVVVYKAVCAVLQVTAGDNKTLPCDYNADACCTDVASLLPVDRHQLRFL
jgi:hypothetical protein